VKGTEEERTGEGKARKREEQVRESTEEGRTGERKAR
jgi:hypothetical protein